MSPVIALMFDCCQRVLRGDQQLLSQLRTAGFECAAGGWQFSLPDLHGFLQAQLPTDECCDYQQFIRRLYASDINHRLCEQRINAINGVRVVDFCAPKRLACSLTLGDPPHGPLTPPLFSRLRPSRDSAWQ